MSRGPVDVFVSFTGADVAWAEWVAGIAEQAGLSVRFQRWDFGAGSNFVAQMSAALADAQRLVMITSGRYWASVMATAEWTAAFARDPGSLLPVRVEDAAPPALLAPIVSVDVFGVGEAEARTRLVAALQGPVRPAGPVAFPGGLGRWPLTPGVFEAPGRPAPLAGRDEVLAELRARLAGVEAVALTQALAGPGGVGKTVLAAEYAWRYRSDYQLVWWVAAEQRPLILESFIRLAPRLGVGVPDDLEALPRLVHQALGAVAGRWLVVFDNAPDHGSVASFLPHGGHVLITSRNPAWGGPHATIDVACLDQATSARYLLARVCKGEPSQVERAAAEVLAVELGGLPLALAQAAAYSDTYGETLAGYLDLFRAQRARLLADAPSPLDYQGSVHTAVNLALGRLADEPSALVLVELLAFLGPETIPLDLLFDDPGTVELPPELAVLAGFDHRHERNLKGIGPLRAVSLIERDPAGVRVHRLTQTVIRDRLDPDRRAARLGLAVALIDHALDVDPEHPDSWPTFAALLPAVRALAGHTRADEVHRAAGLLLAHRLGRYLSSRGDLTAARVIQEQTLAGRRQVLGQRHPDTLASMNNLANTLQGLGDLAGARALHEQVLAGWREVLGQRHPDTLGSMNNLAITLWALGDLAGARALHEEALAVKREVLGQRHPDTLRSMNNLAATLRKLGDLVGARVLVEEALAVCREVLGQRHPRTLASMDTLAQTLRGLGDLVGARVLAEEALAVKREVLGQRHPDTLASMDTLAQTLRGLGDVVGARVLHEEALVVRREVLGQRHYETVISAWGLYRVLCECDAVAAGQVLERDLRWLVDEDPEGLTVDQVRIRDQLLEEVGRIGSGVVEGGQQKRARPDHDLESDQAR